MLEALTLFAALSTADAVGRASPAFALQGELGRFPPAVVLEPLECLAGEHLAWLRHRRVTDRDICPNIDGLWREQSRVVRAYRLLSLARERSPWNAWNAWNECGEPRGFADQLRDLIGETDYFFGKMPGAVP